jgi:NAD(P)-dependent dehydrogenase (short-subunit alcohol dehydrogenase family)
LPESTTAYAVAKAALSTYNKSLSKEVVLKGAPVSPGRGQTDTTVALVERLASRAGTDYEGGKQIIIDALGVSGSDVRRYSRRSPTSSPF